MAAVTHPNVPPSGSCSLHTPLPHVIELRAEGNVPREESDRIFRLLSEHLAQHPEVDTVVWNLLDVISYAPGASAAGIRLVARLVPRIRRSAIITRSRTIAGLTNVSRVMAPTVDRQVFASLGEALSWAAQPSPGHRSRRHRAA